MDDLNNNRNTYFDMKHNTIRFDNLESEEEESVKSRLGIIDSEIDDDDVETYYDTTEDDDSDSDEDVSYNIPFIINTEI